MDVFESLAEQHRRIARLLDQLRQTRDTEHRRSLVPELRQALENHSRIEKEVVYPALRQGNGIDPMIEESLVEHDAMISLITAVERSQQPQQWTSNLDRIKSHLDHHAHEEEHQLFPKGRTVLSADQRERLARDVEKRRADTEGAAHAGTGSSTSGSGTSGETAEAVRQQADEMSGVFAQRTGEFARQARERGRSFLLQGTRSAAQRTDGIAEALHETGENLGRHGHPQLSQYLNDAADGLEHVSRRLEEGDIDSMMQQARTTADRNPGALFGGAVVAGFLLTRFLKSSEEGSGQRRLPQQHSPGAVAEAGRPSPASKPQQSEEIR